MNDTSEQSCLRILSELVAFDTTSAGSNLELIGYVQQFLDQLGIDHRLTYNDEKTKANLWATIGPADRGGIVLSGHTDVVPVAGQTWTSDPFTMAQRGSRIYGRGTADMKGFLACAMAAADSFKNRQLQVPVHLAFSYDEEVGCLGVPGLIADICEHLPMPLAVIVGEPTSMKIIGGNKGGRGYHTKVVGVDGHSSLPDLGANAILAASRIIEHLRSIQDRLIKEADADNGFVPPYTSLDIGLIEGGTASNIIPALCEFHWGFRGLPFENMDALENEVLTWIATEIEPSLKAVSESAGVTTTLTSDMPPLKPDDQSAAETLVRHLSKLNESGRVSYGTEAGHFQAAGIPGVIFGPGSIEQAHLPDEYIELSQIQACIAFMQSLGNWAETGHIP